MFKIVFSKDFLKHFNKLSFKNRVVTDELIGFLAIDYRDSRLHVKKLHGANNFYSFRVGRDYRTTFQFIDGGTIYILDIQHRKDIYR